MCPPGVDQTTRTAQCYHLILPELKQRLQRDEDSYRRGGFTNQFLGDSSHSWVWSALAKPVLSHKAKEPSSQRGLVHLSPLESIPNELLDMIIGHLLCAKDAQGRKKAKCDVLALGLCSEFLLEVVLRRIHSEYLKSTAVWAGKKMALQGSWTTDLPVPFQEDGLAAKLTPTASGRMCDARRFNWHAWSYFETPPLMYREESDWIEALEGSTLTLPLRSRICKELSSSIFFPQDRPWVLRNLSTNEIVRSEAFTRKRRLGGLYEPLGFHHALISKIFWTSQPGYEDEGLGIHLGPWAGHCFDIVTFDDHCAEGNVDGWIDVSREVVNKVEALYEKLTPKETRTEPGKRRRRN